MSASFYSGLIRFPRAAAKRRKLLFRAIVSIGILALLIWILPLDILVDAITMLRPETWLLVTGGFLLGHLVSAFKWRLLLGATGVAIAGREAIRAHGAGLFANLCLPSVVGGDFIRAGVVIRDRGKAENIVLASLADRINDSVALVVIAGIAGLFVPAVTGLPAGRILLVVGLLLLAAVISVLVAVKLVPARFFPGKVAGIMARVESALDALGRSPGVALLAFALSFMIQGGFILLNIMLARAMQLDVPLALWFFAWPLAKLVALAPVSLGGIGVREAAIAGIMAPFGIEAARVVAQSLSWEVVLVASGLFSGAMASLMPGYNGARVPQGSGQA